MSGKASGGWLKVLFGGAGVALLAFAAPLLWDRISFKELRPDYVQTSLRREGDKIIIFVRNLSDEPLDLIKARIVISGAESPTNSRLGTYPEETLYIIDPTTGKATVERDEGTLVVSIAFGQAIAPGEPDQFSFKLSRPGTIHLEHALISGELFDIRGNAYPIKSE